MPTTLPMRRRRHRNPMGEFAWIAGALLIGTLAFWVAIDTPRFSSTLSDLTILSPRSH